MSDEQIIAKKFMLLATINVSSITKSAQLSINSIISHRNSQFSLISPLINVKTIDNQFEHICIFDVKSSIIFDKYFNGVQLDDGRSIDTIYELFRVIITVNPPTIYDFICASKHFF
jgi:hypothetical protein